MLGVQNVKKGKDMIGKLARNHFMVEKIIKNIDLMVLFLNGNPTCLY